MQKIAYFITIPDWGGAQKYVFDMAKKYNTNPQFKISVYSGAPSDNSKINLLENCAKSNIKTKELKHLVRKISPKKDVLVLFEVIKTLNTEKPDIIHLNSSKAGIIGSFAAGLSKHTPKVHYTVHGWVFNEPMPKWKKRFYIFLEKWASKYRDKIIVLGEKEKQDALKYNICLENKLEIKKHFLPQISFLNKSEARQILGLAQDKKIIGTIANFYPSKGIKKLIEVAAQIDNPELLFAVIGDGPERKNYELLITNYKLQDRFLLLGEKENAAQYLTAFDTFVLPSVKEGAPYVILEAMEAKLPIITTNIGAIPEMLEDYPNKTLIPPADVKSLANAIIKNI